MLNEIITITKAMREEKSLTVGEICSLRHDNRKRVQDEEQREKNEEYLDTLLIERLCSNEAKAKILREWLSSSQTEQKPKVLTKVKSSSLRRNGTRTSIKGV